MAPKVFLFPVLAIFKRLCFYKAADKTKYRLFCLHLLRIICIQNMLCLPPSSENTENFQLPGIIYNYLSSFERRFGAGV